MSSTDVISEMRTLARFERLARTPLYARVLSFLRRPGAAEQLGVLKGSTDGELLRALADKKSPQRVLTNCGCDLGSAVKAEVSLKVAVGARGSSASAGASERRKSSQAQEERGSCRRCCACFAIAMAIIFLLGALSLLGTGVWMDLEEIEFSLLDRTWSATHALNGAIISGGLALIIVIAYLCVLLCTPECRGRIRRCTSCKCCKFCRRRTRYYDEDEDDCADASRNLSDLQIVALWKASSPKRSVSNLQLATLNDQVTADMSGRSQERALQLSDAVSNDPSSNYMPGTLGLPMSPETNELDFDNTADMMSGAYSPSMGSTAQSGFKSVTFEDEVLNQQMPPAVVKVANKTSPAVSDPAWHAPNLYSFGARFMGVYRHDQPNPEEEDMKQPMSDAEAFKRLAKKAKDSKKPKVTFPHYADDVFGNPVEELATFRPTCTQFYIDTMFQSAPNYPHYHPGSQQSMDREEKLRTIAASPDGDWNRPFMTPLGPRRPMSNQSLTSAHALSPGRPGDWTSPGNVIGLAAPEKFASSGGFGSSNSPMSTISGTSTYMMAPEPEGFPFRSQALPGQEDPELGLRGNVRRPGLTAKRVGNKPRAS